MTITIETVSMQEVEQLLKMLKLLNIENVNELSPQRQPVITKGDKKLNPRDLFGIWQHSQIGRASCRERV